MKASWTLAVTLLLTFHVQAQEICRGDREDCPDLLKLPIEHYEWKDQLTVGVQCKDLDVLGCAKIYGKGGKLTRCVIHTIRYPLSDLLRHEINHCRGWEHQGGGEKAHSRPWRKMFK